MRVLVTGASGFIGRHVARRFVAGGAEVYALVRAPGARLGIPGVIPVEGDLADPDSLEPLTGLPELDVVCHLAADTRMDATEEEMETNVSGTAALISRLGPSIRNARFLFTSSIAAVDRTKKPRGPLTTDDPPAPRSPYGRSKLRGEELVCAEAKARGFTATCLRLGTIYGPGQEKGGVVTLARAAKAGGLAARLPWPGKISFGHVADVAEVLWRLADRDDPLPGTFFVAEGQAHTMAEVAEVLRGVYGVDGGPIRGVGFILSSANFFLWLPGVRKFAPWSLRAALADTISCDSEPIRAALDLTWTRLEDGLLGTFGPGAEAMKVPAVPEGRPVRSLISGATGFLGAGLAKALADAHGPESVIGLRREPLPESEQDAARELEAAGVRLIPSDLLGKTVFDTDGVEFDVLYHLAAETDSGAPPERLAINTEGTRNLLETIGPALAGKRIVFAGATAAVDRARKPVDLMKETDPENPRTGYGLSKLEAELILSNLAERYGAAWVVPRFSPIWTADLRTGFLGAFADQVRGRSILRRVLWSGRVTMVRREDAVAILRHLGETGAADGRAVHIGDGEVYPYAALIQDLRRWAGDAGWSLPIPSFLWAFIRWCAWLPVVSKFVPWRLSCLLGDDLAVSTERLKSIYTEPMRTWPESEAEVVAAAGLTIEDAPADPAAP